MSAFWLKRRACRGLRAAAVAAVTSRLLGTRADAFANRRLLAIGCEALRDNPTEKKVMKVSVASIYISLRLYSPSRTCTFKMFGGCTNCHECMLAHHQEGGVRCTCIVNAPTHNRDYFGNSITENVICRNAVPTTHVYYPLKHDCGLCFFRLYEDFWDFGSNELRVTGHEF